jgi:hypothetical protein
VIPGGLRDTAKKVDVGMNELGNAEDLDYRGALFMLLELDSVEVSVTISSTASETRARIQGTLQLVASGTPAGASLASRLAAVFGENWREAATIRLATATGSLAVNHREGVVPTLPAVPEGDVELDVDAAAVSLTIREAQFARAWYVYGPGEAGRRPLAVGLAMTDGTTLLLQELPAE